MNERIRELLVEAGLKVNYWKTNPPTPMQILAEYEQFEKFAELIVRECIKESMEEIVADEEIAQEKDPLIREFFNGNNQGIVDAVVRFRNHFGVE